jgi:hypothetical protein
MAAGNWIAYDGLKTHLFNKLIDMDSDTFKMQLHTSSYVPDRTADDVAADLSDEHANANGYTTGGITLTGVAVSEGVAGTMKWTFDAPVWTASGGSIVARYAVILDTTASKLVAYCLLDTTPADVTVTTGNTLTITPHGSGVITLSGATS